MAINRFTGAVNANTGTAGNWSLGVVPTATDGHITTFDATSPNYTVNTNLNCNAIDFTGYTNTGTLTNHIFSYGNTTLSPTMNIVGVGGLIIVASATFTTNGYQWPNRFAVGGGSQSYIFADAVTLLNDFAACGGWMGAGFNPTITLNGNLTIKGNYTGSGVETFNGAYTVYLEGDFIQPKNCNIAGTTPWIWNGTTDKIFSCVNSYNLSNITINGTGVVTFINVFPIGAITFNILSPCIANDCVFINSTGIATTTINTSLVTWKEFRIINSASAILQLNSPVYTSKATLGNVSQPLTVNGSPIYIVDGILQSNPGNAGAILGTSQIIGIGNKCTYYDNATSVFPGQGVWRIPITINSNVFLMFGRFVLSTGGSLIINSITVENKATFRNLPELLVQASVTLTNIHKCKFKNVTISASQTLTMNEFFSGSPEFKTVIRLASGTTNFVVNFTDNRNRISFFVNVKNCTITQRNKLNIIGRDSNSGSNIGILFGESGLRGFPINKFGQENSYSFANGFSDGGMKN